MKTKGNKRAREMLEDHPREFPGIIAITILALNRRELQ
jgi:hypothetical protein